MSAPGRSPYSRRARPALRVPELRRGAAFVRPAFRRRARRRRRLLAWLALFALLAALVPAVRLATRMDSVVVLAARELPGSPEFFYQEDPAWGSDTLGNSDRTLGKAGDEVACLTSLLAMGQRTPEGLSGELNPGTLNAWLTAGDAYDAGGNLKWDRVGALLGAKAVEVSPRRGLGELAERLIMEETWPVMKVRRPDTGAWHAVLAVGTVHGEFVIVDPLDPTGIPNSLSLYDNRIYGLRYLKFEVQ